MTRLNTMALLPMLLTCCDSKPIDSISHETQVTRSQQQQPDVPSHLTEKEYPDSNQPNPRNTPGASALIYTETQGYRHISIEYATDVMTTLLEKDGFAVQHSADSSIFNQNLSELSVIIFLSTTGDILDPSEAGAVRSFVEKGGGWMGIHAAADAEYEWPWYETLVGAWFSSHPAVQEADILVNRAHSATAMLPPIWTRTDEWYDFRTPPPPDATVLLRVNTNRNSTGVRPEAHPIAWTQSIGTGRSIYTGGGHTKESYDEPLFRAHLLAAARWAAGLEP